MQMAVPGRMPYPDAGYLTIIAGNGPKMVAPAGELADGALPATPTPEFTAQARQLLGPDQLLVIYGGSVIGQDAAEVAASVGEYLDLGADHVTVGMAIGTDFAAGVDHLDKIAPALVEI